MNNRKQQVQFVVENALEESSMFSAFRSGLGGYDAIKHASEAHSLLKTYQELRRRDPRHPVLPKLRREYSKQMAKARATSKHPVATKVGAISAPAYENIKSQVISNLVKKPFTKLMDNIFDTETVYGMGGNQPVVGEYSGPKSQRL